MNKRMDKTLSPESEPLSPSLNMKWNYAHGGPVGHCLFKSEFEDFFVDEELPFEPDGEGGEHLYVQIEKQGENTDWVAGELSRLAGIKRQAVSYAGRKDRQGITRQWFCVTLPGMADPDWSALPPTIKVLRQARHLRKLRTGTLKSNFFRITLKEVEADKEQLESLLKTISEKGVPNYYGAQRFGFGGRNLNKALAMFQGKFRANRNKRSVYISAARSWLFNQILSERVEQQSWDQYIAGDVMGFYDSNSLILEPEDDVQQRIDTGDVSPTAALWGRGRLSVSEKVQALEESIAKEAPELCDGLENVGLSQERRVTRLLPREMSWQWSDDKTLVLEFRLPKGCFATSVLSELIDCREVRPVESPAV